MTAAQKDAAQQAEPGIGHNGAPEDTFETVKKKIEDLFEEAKNACDGESIDNQDIADYVTKVHDDLHKAGKEAEDLRVKEKKPLDDKVKEIQEKYAPLLADTKTKKGLVVLGKKACQELLTPWREKLQREKEAEAKRAADLAAKEKAEAEAKIRDSRGNLEDRVVAEEQLAHAKSLEKTAKRWGRAAETGTGLRTVCDVEITDIGKALDWAYAKAPESFEEVALNMANAAARAGTREIDGFKITERKVAR
ncbi:hypothetical protein FIU93_22900 [Labrenzia sp. THAF35]|uniref:hypothetical protein n=1 Tax=Labrenzia sp. THAF35 TaxID=2587854 RepID=UPI00126788DF|nr:hypothetical protein [Labrenzia sp. THAF35]QFT69651.1 hypothetical protein FIU93_22900 [Labrenzia sp. THAF35]